MVKPLYTCVYMYVFKLEWPECMGTCFFKGGVCDTYNNSGNSGENSGILVIL